MKIFTRILFLILTILVSNIDSFGNNTTTYISKDGEGIREWSLATNWEDDKIPSDNNNMKIFINGYIRFTGNYSANNNIEFLIAENSTLEITGDFNVGNSAKVTVEDGGKFIVGGSVDLSPSNSANNAGELIIDGDLIVIGNLKGNGTMTGDGSASIGGTIDGIGFDGFQGDVIGTNAGAYPPPLAGDPLYVINFDAEKYSVRINWLMEGNLTSLVRFEVRKDGKSLQEKSILGPETRSFLDNEDLTAASTPRYEVFAVYSSSSGEGEVKSTPLEVDFSSNPLPIELLSFTAQTQNESVQIEWVTAAEINNDFFTLYRSADGHNWEIIAYMQGAGNSNYTLNYSYTDMQPLPGINYYRLKQTDFDGQFEYFAPIAVQFNKTENANEIMHVRANGNSLNLMVKNQDPAAQIVVADMHGRLIYAQGAPVSDFAQEVRVDFPRNYTGEVVLIRLQSTQKADERKIIIR